MSVKIKISYLTDQELQDTLAYFGGAVKECRISKNKHGVYKKAYIVLESSENSNRNANIC